MAPPLLHPNIVAGAGICTSKSHRVVFRLILALRKKTSSQGGPQVAGFSWAKAASSLSPQDLLRPNHWTGVSPGQELFCQSKNSVSPAKWRASQGKGCAFSWRRAISPSYGPQETAPGVTDVASLAGRQQVVQAAPFLPPGELAPALARAGSSGSRECRLPAVEQRLSAGVLGGPSHRPR